MRKRRRIGANALTALATPAARTDLPQRPHPAGRRNRLDSGIGLWALEHACQQLKIGESHPQTRELQIAVNVSARQFRQSDFVAQVERALLSSQCQPGAAQTGTDRKAWCWKT